MQKIILSIISTLFAASCMANPELSLPWWSPAAPQILKELNFSKVNGSADTYLLNNNYKLTKLKQQGTWSKVYILEKTDNWSGSNVICAVKVLLSYPGHKLSIKEFRLRHWEEIKNTIQISNLDLAIKPYGIIRNDPDHFLLFMQYAPSAKGILRNQSLQTTLRQLDRLRNDLANLHIRGYAHGDVKLDNVLMVDEKLKFCDWFSLTNNNQIKADQCHYAATNMSNPNIVANYYEKSLNKSLSYAIITISNGRKVYWLHPITADRISLGISLLEFVAPEQYQIVKQTPKNFYLYSPLGLTYWPKHKKILQEVRAALIKQANSLQDKQSLKAALLLEAIDLINIEHVPLLGEYVEQTATTTGSTVYQLADLIARHALFPELQIENMHVVY